jgi:hypothetical protein
MNCKKISIERKHKTTHDNQKHALSIAQYGCTLYLSDDCGSAANPNRRGACEMMTLTQMAFIKPDINTRTKNSITTSKTNFFLSVIDKLSYFLIEVVI